MNDSLFNDLVIKKFNGKKSFDKLLFINELGRQRCENCDHGLLNHFDWGCEECMKISCFPMLNYTNLSECNVLRITDVICHTCLMKDENVRFNVSNMTKKTSNIVAYYKNKEYNFPLGGLTNKEGENLTYLELCKISKYHNNLFFKEYMKNQLKKIKK